MRINLLEVPLVKHLFSAPVLLTIRLLVLFIFLYAIVYGFIHPSREENLFTTAVFWSLFWPFFMVITLATVGNIFCMVCPLGFIGRELGRFSLRRRVPSFLKNPYIGLILFNIIAYWFVLYTFPGFWREPVRTALFFAFFLFLSVVVFYLFRGMAFCKYLCPIGIVNSAFSRVGMLWLTTNQESCKNCKKPLCALSCPYELNPSRFEERNSNAWCTYCLDCVRACRDVKLELRNYSHSLFKPVKKPYLWEIWVYVLLVGAITFGMRYHHAIGRTELGQFMPWTVLGNYIQDAFGVPEFVDVSGFLAFVMAVATALVLVALSTYLGSRVSGLPPRKVFVEVGYAFAPLMIVGALSHVCEFFFLHYYHNIVNGFAQAFGLSVRVEPLTERGEAWLHIFRVFPFLAGFWSLYILKRRVELLPVENRRSFFGVSSLLPVYYLLLSAVATVAVLFFRLPHHGH